jgi:hypothetical protein
MDWSGQCHSPQLFLGGAQTPSSRCEEEGKLAHMSGIELRFQGRPVRSLIGTPTDCEVYKLRKLIHMMRAVEM